MRQSVTLAAVRRSDVALLGLSAVLIAGSFVSTLRSCREADAQREGLLGRDDVALTCAEHCRDGVAYWTPRVQASDGIDTLSCGCRSGRVVTLRISPGEPLGIAQWRAKKR